MAKPGHLALVALVVGLALFLAAPAQADQTPNKVTQTEAIEIAKQDPKAIAALREHPNLAPSASKNDSTGLWEVGFFRNDDELVQVVIDPVTGNILESWTCYQVAWRMA